MSFKVHKTVHSQLAEDIFSQNLTGLFALSMNYILPVLTQIYFSVYPQGIEPPSVILKIPIFIQVDIG